MKSTILMHSSLTPDAFADRLRQNIDPEPWSPAPSSSSGMRPLYGNIDQRTFTVYKRRSRRTDCAGAFYGKFGSENAGTKIEGHFITPPWIGYLTRTAIAIAVLLAFPMFARTVRALQSSHRLNGSGDWTSVLLLPFLVTIASFIPSFVRLLGRVDRQFVLAYVQQVASVTTDDLEKVIG